MLLMGNGAKDGIKLNLGCGIVYRPGYVNIDRFDERLADDTSDVISLPYGDNSVSEILAHHVLEHLDFIHAKYALAEWFRILRPRGSLIIETPDLERSLKKLRTKDARTQESTLRWIYGTDSPGMVHKTGFSFDLLKQLLTEIGFREVKRGKQTSHTYEPGMRVECRKTLKGGKDQLFAVLRGKIYGSLDEPDSEALYSLEDHYIGTVRQILWDDWDNDRGHALKRIFAKLALCKPVLSKCFMEAMRERKLMKDSDTEEIEKLLEYLCDIELHNRLLPLWMKTKKSIGTADDDFRKFTERLERLLVDLSGKKEGYEKRLEYISGQKRSDLPLFNFYYVQLRARVLFNMGVKNFHNGNKEKAMKLFAESVMMNPENPLSYWNMARLGIGSSKEKKWISDNYAKSIHLIADSSISGILRKEEALFRKGAVRSIHMEPLSEYSFEKT